MQNMTIYNNVREAPKEALKLIQAGRLKGMSDINPMWRIQALTEQFGPCGFGWWYEITDKRIEFDEITGQKAAFVDIMLHYVSPETGDVSHGIPGTGGASFVANERSGPYLSDECFKMALTDAISVASKALGVAADVYYANGRSKYTKQTQQPTDQPKKQAQAKSVPPPERADIKLCAECGHEITATQLKNGVIAPAAQVIDISLRRFGRCLCAECMKKIDNKNKQEVESNA